MKKYSTLLLCLGWLISCESPDRTTPDGAGYGYFPLETGRYVEYEVHEIRYAVASAPVETRYFVKEVCGQTFVSSTGQEQYRLERYRKNQLPQSWAIDSVWTVYRLPDRAVRVENNVPFVKLLFPVADRATWNGNLLNSLPAEDYQAQLQTEAVSYHELTFPRSLTVVQRYDSTLLTLDKRLEQYAPEVGLIYQESTSLVYCQDVNCIGEGIIESGVSRQMWVLRYGKE
ncbi:hypothetical protein GCM10027275_08950 [Rhabdobacter roseus]|uniref:Lipoprotein n=1 Tax=Rhabdobacter roseus TaxID=1655419 RepID=A0A840TIN0_9BACT|nr:hypothetical protein [Rhabdobacter roseus]MBB5282795.1 hypothetical protein [Rhabdobacter roseus]